MSFSKFLGCSSFFLTHFAKPTKELMCEWQVGICNTLHLHRLNSDFLKVDRESEWPRERKINICNVIETINVPQVVINRNSAIIAHAHLSLPINTPYCEKWSESVRHSVTSDCLWSHGLYVACQTPLVHGNSLGKNTGVGSHTLPSRGSSQSRDWTRVSCTAGRFLTDWATREALKTIYRYSLFLY